MIKVRKPFRVLATSQPDLMKRRDSIDQPGVSIEDIIRGRK